MNLLWDGGLVLICRLVVEQNMKESENKIKHDRTVKRKPQTQTVAYLAGYLMQGSVALSSGLCWPTVRRVFQIKKNKKKKGCPCLYVCVTCCVKLLFSQRLETKISNVGKEDHKLPSLKHHRSFIPQIFKQEWHYINTICSGSARTATLNSRMEQN